MKGNQIWVAILGVLLVLAGAIGLLEISGLIPDFASAAWQWLAPALFALGGLAFLVAFATNPHDRWPAVIPGFVLLAIGVIGYFDDRLGDWAGTVFLGSLGLAFLLLFLARREFWWSIIPAGVLLTLGIVAGVDSLPGVKSEISGAVFFMGLAITFLAVFATRNAVGFRKWALFPAVILAGLGVLVLAVAAGWVDENATWWLYIGPVLLILGGVFVVFKALTKKETPVEQAAPDEDAPLAKG